MNFFLLMYPPRIHALIHCGAAVGRAAAACGSCRSEHPGAINRVGSDQNHRPGRPVAAAAATTSSWFLQVRRRFSLLLGVRCHFSAEIQTGGSTRETARPDGLVAAAEITIGGAVMHFLSLPGCFFNHITLTSAFKCLLIRIIYLRVSVRVVCGKLVCVYL